MPDQTIPDPALLAGLRKALGRPLPLQAKGQADGLFPAASAGQLLAERAKELRLVEEITEQQAVTSKRKGKETTTVKAVKVWRLTETGRRYLAEADSPKPLLDALLQAVQKLNTPQEKPAADPAAFVAQIEQATQACVGAIDKAFHALQKTIQSALADMQQAVVAALPKPVKGTDAGPVLTVLQDAVRRIAATASSQAAHTVSQATVSPSPTEVKSVATNTPTRVASQSTISPETLRAELKKAYDHLCLFVEFRARVVDVPRLFHETKKQLPTLAVEQFHRALEGLRDERKIELHVLNEVATARERELAIWKNERLYYYVLWN